MNQVADGINAWLWKESPRFCTLTFLPARRTPLWVGIDRQSFAIYQRTELGMPFRSNVSDDDLNRLLTIAVTNAARRLKENDSRLSVLSYAATCIYSGSQQLAEAAV